MSYAIDPELLPWLDMLPSAIFTDYEGLVAARTQRSEMSGLIPGYEPANPIDVHDTAVPGPSDAPDVPVRIYRPAGRTDAVPGLVYLHGGGFILGDLDMFHPHVLRLVDELGIVVVSVDYRLAPEHPFPAPVEDC